jgi:hypothetical protein
MFSKKFFVPFVALFAASSAIVGCVGPDGDEGDVGDVGDVGDADDSGGEVSDGADAVTFTNSCSATQRGQINTYINKARAQTAGAITFFNNTSASSARFVTYFGPDVASRRATVSGKLRQIQTRLAAQDFTVACAPATDAVCKTGKVGYASSGLVTLCARAFTSGDTIGGEIMLHEVSHTLGAVDTACGNTANSINGASCYQGFVYNGIHVSNL